MKREERSQTGDKGKGNNDCMMAVIGAEEGTQELEVFGKEAEDPNACEMKRIKGLHTSRKCGGRRMSD